MIHFITKSFHELTAEELYALLKLRTEVFVMEQQCLYMDMDDKDRQCLHVMGYDGEQLAAYSRLVPAGVSYPEPSIGRVVTSTAFRKSGYGKLLMQYSVTEAKKQFNTSVIVISAQHYLEKFYTELGFVSESDVYLEDDIPHIKMRYSRD